MCECVCLPLSMYYSTNTTKDPSLSLNHQPPSHTPLKTNVTENFTWYMCAMDKFLLYIRSGVLLDTFCIRHLILVYETEDKCKKITWHTCTMDKFLLYISGTLQDTFLRHFLILVWETVSLRKGSLNRIFM